MIIEWLFTYIENDTEEHNKGDKVLIKKSQ